MTGIAFERETSSGEVDALPVRYYFVPCGDRGIDFASYHFAERGYCTQSMRGLQFGEFRVSPDSIATITSDDSSYEVTEAAVTCYVPDQTVRTEWSGTVTGCSLGLTQKVVERITGAPFSAWRTLPLVGVAREQKRIAHLLAALDTDEIGELPPDPIYVESIVVAVIRATGGLPNEQWRRSATLSSDQVRRIRDLIAENIREPLSLRTMAEAVGLSESYFVRAFKGSFDVTPYQYLLRERVRLAQTMIGTSDIPLGEIATRCGFPDARRMGRTFRQLTGRSPSGGRVGRRPG